MSVLEYMMMEAVLCCDLATLKEVWDADVANSAPLADDSHPGYYAMHHVVKLELVDMLKYMLENGANPNVRTNHGGNTPIIAAVWWPCTPRVHIVRLLMQHGANPYIKNWAGRNAFSSEWIGAKPDLRYLESYLVVELVTGEADNLSLDMWRVVTPFLYK